MRYALGAASHSAFTPGGLFAPLLLLGAQLGLLCGVIAGAAFPGLGIDPVSFAVVGMAAFFVGVVRAPVTGIVLVIEMTAAFTSLLPMLAASFAAMLVAQWMGSAPIYDSLRSRVLGLPPRSPRPEIEHNPGAAPDHKSMTTSRIGCEQQTRRLPSAGFSSGSGP